MRYLMTFEYDGSKYNGYQKQPNKNTIQDEIESKLLQINSNKSVIINASGRTDRGVHAYNQKAHFDLDKVINCQTLKHSLNNMLSHYIFIKKIEMVEEDFHARFNVTKKKYIYKINLGEYRPTDYDYIFQYNKNLNIEEMNKAIVYFIGKHNFKSYTKATDIKENYIREIFDARIIKENQIITISFTGSGFMRYMVRNMVGSLIEVGQGKKEATSIKEILDKEDRIYAGITAVANGLYLEDVYYD